MLPLTRIYKQLWYIPLLSASASLSGAGSWAGARAEAGAEAVDGASRWLAPTGADEGGASAGVDGAAGGASCAAAGADTGGGASARALFGASFCWSKLEIYKHKLLKKGTPPNRRWLVTRECEEMEAPGGGGTPIVA